MVFWCETVKMSRPVLDFAKLSAEERLRLIEQLWDSLSDSPDAVPMTARQREELDRRLDDMEREPIPDGIPWDEVVRQLRARRT